MGGLLNRIFGSSSADVLVDKVVLIHGKPYRFIERLGAGSFGSVYAARGPHGLPVAVKVLNINGLPMRTERLVKTYLNEVSLLEYLRRESQHVVQIYDFDFDPSTGFAYIVMELGSDNLGKMILNLRRSNSSSSLPPDVIRSVWRQMLSIVTTLHRNGIIHMDLKPENLIRFGPVLKIADLGISRRANAAAFSRVGTPFFSAPEIMQDKLGKVRHYSAKCDIWSMGAILYCMVYGRPPAYSANAASPPPEFPEYPDPFVNDILRRTLTLNPDYRANLVALSMHPFTNS